MFLKTCQNLSFLLGLQHLHHHHHHHHDYHLTKMINIIFLSFLYLASCISSTQNIGDEVRSCSILSKDPTDGVDCDVDDGCYNHEGIVDDDEEEDSDCDDDDDDDRKYLKKQLSRVLSLPAGTQEAVRWRPTWPTQPSPSSGFS